MFKTFNSYDFIQKIKFLQKLHSITLIQFAELSGVSSSSLYNILLSQNEPRLSMIISIAKNFKISIDSLVDSEKYSLEDFKEYILNSTEINSEFLYEKINSLTEKNEKLKQELEDANEEIKRLGNLKLLSPKNISEEVDRLEGLRDLVKKGHFEAIFTSLRIELKMREELDALILIEAQHSDNENSVYSRFDKNNYHQTKQQIRNALLNLINKIPNQNIDY